jgi:desulfoferrodoxin (superoxide reductase-like protein)
VQNIDYFSYDLIKLRINKKIISTCHDQCIIVPTLVISIKRKLYRKDISTMKKLIPLGCIMIMIMLGLLVAGCSDVDVDEKIVKPKFHTQSDEGIWIAKSDTHLPIVTFIDKDTIDVRVPLRSTKRPYHYTEVIFLMDGDREIDSKNIPFSYEEPHVRFKLPSITKGNYKVVAKCNLHDMWMTPVVLPSQK